MRLLAKKWHRMREGIIQTVHAIERELREAIPGVIASGEGSSGGGASGGEGESGGGGACGGESGGNDGVGGAIGGGEEGGGGGTKHSAQPAQLGLNAHFFCHGWPIFLQYDAQSTDADEPSSPHSLQPLQLALYLHLDSHDV